MGSETEVQAPPAAPAAAASGGSKTGMILAIVVVMVVVVAALAYVFVLDGGSGDELSGQWTLAGGTFSIKMTLNNDTANLFEMSDTFNASTEIIDFDVATTEVGDMTFEDLGNGNFRLTGFEEMVEGIGDIEGTYDIDGDTMTVNIDQNASLVDDDGNFVEYEMDITWNLERA